MERLAIDKPLKIDTRPLWLIVVDRTARYQVLTLLALAEALLFRLAPPAGLSVAGYHALLLFGGAVFLWVTGLLPLAVTALLILALLPLTGVLAARQTYALFGNEALFFILGAFILAAAMTGTGLAARLARAMLLRFGRTPRRLALTVFLLAAGLSFCMSEHAVAAMLFPVVAEIADSLGLKPGRSSYARLLFLAIAWGCIIGGIATFLGGARAPLAVGLLRENSGLDFTFFEWTAAAAPIVGPLLVSGFLLLTRFFPVDVASVAPGLQQLNRKRLEMGKLGGNELLTGLVMLATIGGWVVFGRRFGLANIALLAAALLFAFRVVSWQKIEEYVNWGIVLMYGGSIALASALQQSGAALWLVRKGLAAFTPSPFALVAVVSLVAMLLTECISHAAVVAILMPIGLGLAKGLGIDPRVLTLAIALPAGLAYCLPMGTPATAIVYGSGYLKSRDIVIPGAAIMALSWLLFLATAWLVWPLLGLTI
ncbi:sodium/dicarboxylate or sulfate cotransporter [Geotalea uraniireducens]|uniref:Sodium/dicarboxylate or sulfate cotransporter n=1 Tax=Geotalea uraniireducens TaxID=351604 RepID=A0ABN6VVC5_9BACT|nr:DASS family sodium-coupled anion symporter [Geotalea uraniireducens]BDV42132.1 sodium/dicarboxylate or sulfate cotransporter [Geotalea uraniireducens]